MLKNGIMFDISLIELVGLRRASVTDSIVSDFTPTLGGVQGGRFPKGFKHPESTLRGMEES